MISRLTFALENQIKMLYIFEYWKTILKENIIHFQEKKWYLLTRKILKCFERSFSLFECLFWILGFSINYKKWKEKKHFTFFFVYIIKCFFVSLKTLKNKKVTILEWKRFFHKRFSFYISSFNLFF